jgi:selenocysteine-specific elongation factor
MTVVVGTAGHVDHGKTTLLRALTGIDADRLPEERRRGMTIEVGYAHLALPDGDVLDFVDVPGHDRLVGNMLVGAGEIDAVLLVVAADDGPRAQTREHLELLDALRLRHAVVAVTKADAVAPARVGEVVATVRELLAPTTFAGAPVVAVSALTGAGIEALAAALAELRDRARADGAGAPGPARLAVDRGFGVKGRGTVVTGTLRGGPLPRGATLRLEPGGGAVRARELQVRGAPVAAGGPGGRLAANVAGAERPALERGVVLTDDPAVVATDRLLVALRPALVLATGGAGRRDALPAGATVRLHQGTAQAEGVIRRSRRDVDDLPDGEATAILRLAIRVAAAPGDRFVLRRPSPAEPLAGGRVLDPRPPTGAAWRRATATEVGALARAATPAQRAAALLALHGAVPRSRSGVASLPAGSAVAAGRLALAPAVASAVVAEALAEVAAAPGDGIPLAELRGRLGRAIRRRASVDAETAAEAGGALVEALVGAGRLARSGDLVHAPGRAVGLGPEVVAAMGRLETILDAPAPPPLAQAARAAGCPPAGIRALESAGRIIRVDEDLAWSAPAFGRLQSAALRLATPGPLTPAALRDVTGTSRKYVMALLEELNRRGVLARTPGGHVRGPRAGAAPAVSSPPVTGIVLAGGRSTRFGGDKLTAEVGGRPLLHLAIIAVAAEVDEIVVVVGADAPAPALPDVPVPVVVARDAIAGQGPLGGLSAGIAAAAHPAALLVGGDQPALQPALLRELLRRLGTDTGGPPLDVVGVEEEGRLRPLPVALRVGTVGPAAAVALGGGTRSLVGLFGRLRAGTLSPAQWRQLDPAGDSLRDVDEPDDLPST